MKTYASKILITGGTGLIGRALVNYLNERAYSIHVLTRNSGPFHFDTHLKYFHWDWEKGEIDPKALEDIDILIHLAGANISNHRWTKEYKKEIRRSRIDSLEFLQKTLEEKSIRLKHFIGASAIGYYGCITDDLVRYENHPPAKDFLGKLVSDWEKASLGMQSVAGTVSVLRFGVVLSPEGGAFPKMLKTVKVYAGAPLGTGRQWFNWIHIDDLVRMINFVIEQKLEGIFNAVAPEPVRNAEFMKMLNTMTGKFSIFPRVPAFVLKTIYGEMSCLLLEGVPVSAQKITDAGFSFRYHHPAKAVSNLIQRI